MKEVVKWKLVGNILHSIVQIIEEESNGRNRNGEFEILHLKIHDLIEKENPSGVIELK